MNFDINRMKEALECPVSDMTVEDLYRMIDEGKTWQVTGTSWLEAEGDIND